MSQKPLQPMEDLSHLSDSDVLALWVSAMDELRRRGITRSANNPTGDYAERFIAEKLHLSLQGNSAAGYDAIGADGTRYQIKSRRLATPQTSRQLSPIRNLKRNPFDYLIVLLLGPKFYVLECWKIPIDAVRDYAKYRSHVNGHILHASGAVLLDQRTVRLAEIEQVH